MKKKIIYFLVLMLIFIYSSSTIAYAEESWPDFPSSCDGMASKSAAVIDCHSHTLLVGKNEDETYYPASITKIMTTLLALEKDPSMSKDVTVTPSDFESIPSGYALFCDSNKTETFSMEDALGAVMFQSANEVAQAVGESVAGSNEDFAKMMTQKAKQLGCKDTNFVNANGIPNDEHYTTAYDMCLISSAALEIPAFRELVGNPRSTIAGREVNFYHSMAKNKSAYPYCIGGKTGMTDEAGYTLATFGEQNNMRIACVTMKGSRGDFDVATTDKLMRYAFDNFKSINISKEDNKNIAKETENIINTFADRFSKDSSATITYNQDATATLPSNADFSDAKIELDINESAQINPGKNKIGELCYTYSDKTVCKTPLYLVYNENSLSDLLSSTDASNNSSMLLLNNSSSSITNVQSIIIDSLLIGFILSIVLILVLITKNFIQNKMQ